jgi:hypothetical protein
MNLKRRLKLWLLNWLLGESEEINREVEYTYAEIWPKHEGYETKTKQILKEIIIRARRDGRLAERKEMENGQKSSSDGCNQVSGGR